MPVLFIPHGAGPCFFMDWTPKNTWDGMASFLSGLADTLSVRPRVILVVSAHWCTPVHTVTSSAKPALIYDYFGFPEHTYQLQYPAPGDPDVAEAVMELIMSAGIDCFPDGHRGLDHGSFIPLKLIYPKADVPIVQLSLTDNLDPASHIRVGKAIAGLREQGVLIVGSGMSFHNMAAYGDPDFTRSSEIFDNWLTRTLESNADIRNEALANWPQAPCALHCHPMGSEEHLMPLMVSAGAAGDDPGRRVYSEIVMETRLSAFQFG